MNCNNALSLLPDHLDGILDNKKKKELKDHIQNCENCSNEFEKFTKVITLVQELPKLSIPRDIRQNVFDEIAKTEEKQKILTMMRGLQIAACLMLSFALGIWLFKDQRNFSTMNVTESAPQKMESKSKRRKRSLKKRKKQKESRENKTVPEFNRKKDFNSDKWELSQKNQVEKQLSKPPKNEVQQSNNSGGVRAPKKSDVRKFSLNEDLKEERAPGVNTEKQDKLPVTDKKTSETSVISKHRLNMDDDSSIASDDTNDESDIDLGATGSGLEAVTAEGADIYRENNDYADERKNEEDFSNNKGTTALDQAKNPVTSDQKEKENFGQDSLSNETPVERQEGTLSAEKKANLEEEKRKRKELYFRVKKLNKTAKSSDQPFSGEMKNRHLLHQKNSCNKCHKADIQALHKKFKISTNKNSYSYAKQCYECHFFIGKDKNTHKFDSKKWDAFFKSKNTQKNLGNENRVIKNLIHLEYSLRGLGKATEKDNYSEYMKKAIMISFIKLRTNSKKEIQSILKQLQAMDINIHNQDALIQLANEVNNVAILLANDSMNKKASPQPSDKSGK